MIYKNLIITALFVSSLYVDTKGQAARTPFSSFGLGRQYSNALTYNQGMGGMGISAPDYLHFNSLNPALLVFNRLTVIEVGFVGEQRWLTNNKASEQSSGVSLNYLALGLPIKAGKWTTGIGLSPRTYMKHELHYTTNIEDGIDSASVEESGEGGINELYWSNGVALTKNLSIGLKASYFFGALTSEYGVALAETNQAIKYKANIFERHSFSGFGASVGLSFHLDSLFGRQDYQFNAGVVYSTQTSLQTTLYRNVERRNAISITDSATLVSDKKSTTIYPQSVAGGISFGKKRNWLIGIDFTYNKFSQFLNFDGNSEGAQDSWKIALGGKFSPKEGVGDNYFRLITYQMGLFFEKIPYTVNKNETNNLGLAIGISLPIRNVSSINLVAKIGKQGDLGLNAVEETYFKFYCGITFNDQWFIRRKFD